MKKKVEITAIRSDGREFNYNSNDWGVTSLAGVDFSPIEIFKSERGAGHGVIITGKRKDARDIEIVAVSRIASNNERDREMALAFHNANYTFDIKFTYMGHTRIAKNCELQGAKCPAGNVYERQKLTVSFLAPDADLFADVAESTSFEERQALWHVTRVYTEGGALPFGVVEIATEKEINYLGSEPAPVTCEVIATGYVENINIGVNGIVCHVDCELSDGDVLLFDGEKRTITINGVRVAENKYNAEVIPDMLIEYGLNSVSIKADDEGNIAFSSKVKFTGRYGGL